MKEADRKVILPRAEIIANNRRVLIVAEVKKEADDQARRGADARELLGMTSKALEGEPDGPDLRKMLVEASGAALRELERLDEAREKSGELRKAAG